MRSSASATRTLNARRPSNASRRTIAGVKTRGLRPSGDSARSPSGRWPPHRPDARAGSGAVLRLVAPEFPGQPVEPQVLEGLGQRLAGLAVIADFRVPGVHHRLPLLANGLALGGAVV